MEWIVANRELARFLLLGRDPGVLAMTEIPLRELNRSFFSAVSEWMAPAIARGELRELPSALLTALWLGPSQELARLWLSGRMPTTPSTSIPMLARAAWKSLSLEDEGRSPTKMSSPVRGRTRARSCRWSAKAHAQW